ncbi:hypothetical protein CcaCcLH18_00727 [Colletotrichum camelliae]|nr:hypothetical protein CcaCcLH18_00727 [Colletotrichum camelliae]
MDSQPPDINTRLTYEAEEVFLNTKAPMIDDVFGGLTITENGMLKIPNHYKKLEPTLQKYVCQDGKIPWGSNPSKWEWEALFEDIATEEAKATNSDRGAFDVFNRMIIRIGDKSDAIDPWINLIPNEYGLCVVKCSFAVLLRRAREYADKRKAILDAFVNIRDIMKEAAMKGVHFQADAEAYRCAGDLYEAAVDAIQILSTIIDDLGHHKYNCRVAILKSVGETSDIIQREVEFVRWQNVEFKGLLSRILEGQFDTVKEVQRTQQVLEEMAGSRNTANESLLEIHRETMKSKLKAPLNDEYTSKSNYLSEIESAALTAIDRFFGQASGVSSTRPKSSRAVVCLEDLFQILCNGPPDQRMIGNTTLSLDTWRVKSRELQIVLAAVTKFGPRSQAQANSLLHQDRFFKWMHKPHPDMLLVDGNISDAARGNISPMSLLCANLGLTMAKRETHCVFVHFYCGLHTDPYNDNWYGPIGMLRSLIFQFLTALVERNSLDLEFLDQRNYVRGIEQHNIEMLCRLFEDVVRQFDARTTIYCIVDGVSKYDVDLRNEFFELQIVIQRLQEIVRTESLRSKFKILMTVPFRSSLRLKNILWDEHYISLPLGTLGHRVQPGRFVGFSLSRPSTPLIAQGGPSRQERPPDLMFQDYLEQPLDYQDSPFQWAL